MGTLSAAKIVYSAGFFITVSPESMEVASNEMLKTGGTYCMNLSLASALFLIHFIPCPCGFGFKNGPRSGPLDGPFETFRRRFG